LCLIFKLKKRLKQRLEPLFYYYTRGNEYFCKKKKDTMAKGRNKHLIAKRNEALLRRYYHLTERERLRFDDAVRLLSEREFFISEERVMAIIRDCGHRIAEITAAPVPRIRKPRLTAGQLSLLFTDAQ
jgi:hypothetical protein